MAWPALLVVEKMTAGLVSVATSVEPSALVRVTGTATEAVGRERISDDATVVRPSESVVVTETGTTTAELCEGGELELSADWTLSEGAWLLSGGDWLL